jgi:serine/threonine protein kinase
LFAAGILLWELCAGRRLYKGTEPEMLEMARRGVVQPLPERGFHDQPQLQAILNRALTFDPAMRYQSAAQMLDALDNYALSAQLMASQLRFGAFLTEQFSEDIIALRLAREEAAAAALLSPPVQVSHPEPVSGASERPPAHRPRSPVPRSAVQPRRELQASAGPALASRAAPSSPQRWLWVVLALATVGLAALFLSTR